MDDVLRRKLEAGRNAGFTGFAAIEFAAGFSSSPPAARWIAPSTPPPPRSEQLAAFTMTSTSSVVMSSTMILIIFLSPYLVFSKISAAKSRQ
jgi:hypothetical protein